MTVVTSGRKYIDIDAYAGCIAYAVLLNATGCPAKAVTTAPANESIPECIKKLGPKFDKYAPTRDDSFVMFDISYAQEFDSIVDLARVTEVIDHHAGFEDYWAARPEVKTQIEFIGCACTIVYERFVKCGCTHLLTGDLCHLMTAAILDQTLNLKAKITTKRDIVAFKQLVKIGKIKKDWTETYFCDCERGILLDLKSAIINDIKPAPNSNLPQSFGQLVVYNGEKFISDLDVVLDCLKGYDEWMMNLISLSSGKSYIIANSETSKGKLETLFAKKFVGDVLILKPFMLRKEIMRYALLH
ncbi:MAG: DHH family phosphoesterase [Christensenellaceae bacterium]|jgi:inorganic pyrophosphatase|nr:DHH family phosphoesterase [Christensenellaceae bacterium]